VLCPGARSSRPLARARRGYGATASGTKFAILLLVVTWACALSRPARAWTASGHMQIALAAYVLLPPELQHELVDLLRQHPRFSDDFLTHLPPEVRTDDALGGWIFAQAATWPDLARDQAEHAHKSWHYVNLPLNVRHRELVSCTTARAAFTAASAREAAGASAPETILDGFAWSQRTLADASQPPAQRAVALSWLLHLVGDAHQPLHAVALFSDKVYASGDRGGNDILLIGRGSLHQVWDGLLGQDIGWRPLGRAAEHLLSDPLRRAAGRASRELDVNAWLDESCSIARTFVYVPAILFALQNLERGPLPRQLEIALKDAYVDTARGVAKQRAAIASARLAAWLQALMPRH
jgi:hypothetical protein